MANIDLFVTPLSFGKYTRRESRSKGYVMDTNQKLSQFIQLTGAPITVARKYIADCHGDVGKAVNQFKLKQSGMNASNSNNRSQEMKPPSGLTRNSDTLPPSGLQSNTSQRSQVISWPQNGPQKVQTECHVSKITIGKPNAGGGVPMTNPQTTTNLIAKNVPGSEQPKAPASPSISSNHKLKRGLSKTSENMMIVEQARSGVLKDIEEWSEAKQSHSLDMLDYTFVLPDINVYSEDFRAFLHKDLIETSTLVSLEQAGRLNWWADLGVCQRLLPLATTGDGNCLLHAASLGMWGFHDRHLNLRTALHATLNNFTTKSAIWRRWRWHQTQVNKESGLVYSESEWQCEWENLLKLASTKPRTAPGSHNSCCDSHATNGLMERNAEEGNSGDDIFYESLEEFHVFVLAHVLRRPIIVVADTMLKDSNGEALAPIPFEGVYLPLECEPATCHRSPLLLTYDASHFSGLVAMTNESTTQERPLVLAAIPLVDPELQLLTLHYYVDPGPAVDWKRDTKEFIKYQLTVDERLDMIKRYLDVTRLPIPGSVTVDDLPADVRSRSGSLAGSLDSDDSSATHNSKTDKGKMAKQMQSIKTSFGSIGKTMSKKLKTLGGAGKAFKDIEKKKGAIGSQTQSTKRSSITAEMLSEKDHILVVRLSIKQPEYHGKLVKNYLLAAKERFDKDSELRQKQDREMMEKVEQRKRSPSGQMAQCVNHGCEGLSTSVTSYLCQECFEKSKKEALDIERKPDGSNPKAVVGIGKGMPRQDTLTNIGKSKFYTDPSEDHSISANTAGRGQNNGGNVVRPQTNNASNTLHLSKSCFYTQTPVTGTTQSVTQAKPQQPSRLQQSTVYIDNRLRDGAEIRSHTLPANTHSQHPPSQRPPSQHPSSQHPSSQHPSSQQHQQQNQTFDLALDAPYIDAGSPSPKSPNRGAFRGAGEDQVDHHLADRLQTQSLTRNPQEKCRNQGCQFYGSAATGFLCSSCYREYQKTLVCQATKVTSQRL